MQVEQAASPAFDMKAGHYTIPSLLIREDDSDALDSYLAAQVARLPRFFEQAPIVIDLSQYPAEQSLDSFPAIVGMIRGYGMFPVGVRGASRPLREQAALLELAIMPEFGQRKRKPPQEASRPKADSTTADTLIIDRPVRSGQRVYAQGGDLVLLEGVSSGAEVTVFVKIDVAFSIMRRDTFLRCYVPDSMRPTQRDPNSESGLTTGLDWRLLLAHRPASGMPEWCCPLPGAAALG